MIPACRAGCSGSNPDRGVLTISSWLFLPCIFPELLICESGVLDVQNDRVGMAMSQPAIRLEPCKLLAVFASTFTFANARKYSGSLPVLALMLSMYALYVIVFGPCICQDDLKPYWFCQVSHPIPSPSPSK